MRFIPSSGLIFANETVIVNTQHPNTQLTNIDTAPSVLEHSENAQEWEILRQLNPEESVNLQLEKPYLRASTRIYLHNTLNDFHTSKTVNPVNPPKEADISSQDLAELRTHLEAMLSVTSSSLLNSFNALQSQVEGVNELLPTLANKTELTALSKELKNDLITSETLDTYVLKGNNGTWATNPDTPVRDCFVPTIIGYYTPETQSNRPNSYGSLHSFSSQGTLTKQHNNWITTLAFGTDARIFYNQSINAGQTAWFEIATTESRQAIIQSNGIQMGQNITQRNVTATGFVKRTAKLSDTTPPRGSGKSINHPFNKNKIVGISYRIDGDGFSSCQGLSIEIHDTHFAVESIFTNASLGNKPVTFYVEYEP